MKKIEHTSQGIVGGGGDFNMGNSKETANRFLLVLLITFLTLESCILSCYLCSFFFFPFIVSHLWNQDVLIHGLAARTITVIVNKLGQGCSQCCHFCWVIRICQTHKCWICYWKYLQKDFTVIWQTKKSLCLQKGMKTEQWSIYFILMKPVFLLKE